MFVAVALTIFQHGNKLLCGCLIASEQYVVGGAYVLLLYGRPFPVTGNETTTTAATVSEIIRTIPGNDQLGMNTGNRTIANLNICCLVATDLVERMIRHYVFPVSDLYLCDI